MRIQKQGKAGAGANRTRTSNKVRRRLRAVGQVEELVATFRLSSAVRLSLVDTLLRPERRANIPTSVVGEQHYVIERNRAGRDRQERRTIDDRGRRLERELPKALRKRREANR